VTKSNQQLRVATKCGLLHRLSRDQRGAGLVEYILLAGLIAIACIGAFQAFQGNVSRTVTNQGKKVETVLAP
jgi:Flp pilus assembly pilin Flp